MVTCSHTNNWQTENHLLLLQYGAEKCPSDGLQLHCIWKQPKKHEDKSKWETKKRILTRKCDQTPDAEEVSEKRCYREILITDLSLVNYLSNKAQMSTIRAASARSIWKWNLCTFQNKAQPRTQILPTAVNHRRWNCYEEGFENACDVCV